MARLTRHLASGSAALAVLLAACGDAPSQPLAPEQTVAAVPATGLPTTAQAGQDLARLRKATAHYHDVARALGDGFLAPPPEACVAAAPGGMGYHYVNPARMDLEIDADLPEVLLYEPMENGKLRLVGAEFLVHGDAWDAANDDPPTFAGQEFDPPADRSATQPPGPFYTLHVWIWRANPDGMFQPFNPMVSCD